MRRAILAVATLLTVACIPMPQTPPMPEQLAPQKLTSPLPVVDVVRRATAKLVDLGFDIALSDATGGIVQSKHIRAGAGTVTCRWGKGSMAERYGVATLTISINAVRDGERTAVTITSRVLAEYPGLDPMFLSRLSPTEDCASTGAAERDIATAISTP